MIPHPSARPGPASSATTSAVRRACRWRRPIDPPPALTRALPTLHPAVVGTLASRGWNDPVEARRFMAARTGDDDPLRLAGMRRAVARLGQAVRAGETIVIYGDYDADGVTASAVLIETLYTLGADVRSYIPHRGRDGYGVHTAALEALARDGAGVVVTVDCGIRAAEEVAAAAAAGLDVIITDHHVLPGALPDAVAIVNPRRPDCRYGFDGLSGVGLAYKLAQALLRAAGGRRRPGQPALTEEALLDLVALGTVADVVPLVGENRALVRRGLEVLRDAARPGVRALMEVAGASPDTLTARDIAFSLAPRLNAAGRMGEARPALELLLTRRPEKARQLAAELDARNHARRAAVRQHVAAAEAALAGRLDAPFLLHVDPEVPVGIVGLVAGRLSERYRRPAAVLRAEDDVARGSARSIEGFDITAALDTCAELLVRYGGHARAAGFTVRRADLPALEARLSGLAVAALEGRDLRPTLQIDARVAPEALDWSLHAALQALEPYGEGNPPPRLLLRDVLVSDARIVGQDHLKLVIERGPVLGSIDAMAFGGARRLDDGDGAPAVGARADLVCSLRENVWNGRRELELKVIDIGPPGAELEG